MLLQHLRNLQDKPGQKPLHGNSRNLQWGNPHIDLLENGSIIIPQSKLFPDRTKKQNHSSSLDTSWQLDRSDGANRSLNLTEIEEKKTVSPLPNLSPTIQPIFFGRDPWKRQPNSRRSPSPQRRRKEGKETAKLKVSSSPTT